MAALGWLLNLGFAGGDGGPTIQPPGVEFTLRENRCHCVLEENRAQYELRENRCHFVLEDED